MLDHPEFVTKIIMDGENIIPILGTFYLNHPRIGVFCSHNYYSTILLLDHPVKHSLFISSRVIKRNIMLDHPEFVIKEIVDSENIIPLLGTFYLDYPRIGVFCSQNHCSTIFLLDHPVKHFFFISSGVIKKNILLRCSKEI
jgi:hypothetical protein